MTSLRLLSALALCVAACGSDDGGGTTIDAAAATIDAAAATLDAAAAADAAGAPDAASDIPDAAQGAPDAPSDVPDAAGGAPDAAPANTAPTISSVTWTAPSPCTAGQSGAFAISITATDVETPGDLTYSGSASGCQGTISAATGSLTCPNIHPYPASVTVKDLQGASAKVSFTISPCESGSAP